MEKSEVKDMYEEGWLKNTHCKLKMRSKHLNKPVVVLCQHLDGKSVQRRWDTSKTNFLSWGRMNYVTTVQTEHSWIIDWGKRFPF